MGNQDVPKCMQRRCTVLLGHSVWMWQGWKGRLPCATEGPAEVWRRRWSWPREEEEVMSTPVGRSTCRGAAWWKARGRWERSKHALGRRRLWSHHEKPCLYPGRVEREWEVVLQTAQDYSQSAMKVNKETWSTFKYFVPAIQGHWNPHDWMFKIKYPLNMHNGSHLG